MTTGATLYLVSACGTAEEFVAAFRRYADRTGLFIPSAAPLPAGKRGRIALTLKDGGVMIEGQAEILQSSAKPTVLHGRPGMTVKFVEADDLSKTVISELEKARLAMRPAPPSVPPRPANVPAEPRPVVPAVGGRIDAANALAECVVIGDAAVLESTAGAPKAITDAGSGKAKFVVPSIPLAGSPRSKSPTTPPEAATGRPKSPTTPPDAGARPKSSTTPPDPASKPVPVPANLPNSSRMTSIGFPIVDKLPAFPPKTSVPGATPAQTKIEKSDSLLQTLHGTQAPANPTVEMKALVDDEATSVGEAPPKAPAPATTVSMAWDAQPEPPAASEAAAAVTPVPAAPTPTPAAASRSGTHRATSIGFPAMRTPFETQPVGTVRPPPSGNAEPAPPVMPRPDRPTGSSPPLPRGKSATRPPLTPRHPTPVAPVPIVRSPAKAAPIVEDEKTDLSEVPAPAPAAAEPQGLADAALPGGEASEQAKPARSGGMRASEIMAAIPTDDWTMTPEAAAPTVLPAKAPDVAEPTGPRKGPPTGNWTISLDPAEGTWGEPEKIETPAAPPPPEKKPAKPRAPKGGNPDIAVSSAQPFTAVEWEEKPTGIGEAKIEIDPTLMEPLKPMPALDDEPAAPLAPPPEPQPGAHARAGTEPLAGVTSLVGGLRAPSTPVPIVPPRPISEPVPLVPQPPTSQPVGAVDPLAATMSPIAAIPALPSPPSQPASAPGASMFGYSQPGFDPLVTHATSASRSRKRVIIIAAAALAAVVAGFLLVLLLSGDDKPKPAATVMPTTKVEPSNDGSAAVAQPSVGSGSAVETGSAEEAGSAEQAVAVEAPSVDAGVEEPVTNPPPDVASGPCKVTITSVPTGADVLSGKNKLGTTPAEVELPCGAEAKLTLRKAKFSNASRTFTPVAGKPNTVAVKLAKTTFTLKVTSTPAGATITVRGRSMGITPTTIRLPAFEAAAIVVSKPGYTANTKKVTPKSNNVAHHVTLKKKGR